MLLLLLLPVVVMLIKIILLSIKSSELMSWKATEKLSSYKRSKIFLARREQERDEREEGEDGVGDGGGWNRVEVGGG